jgi:tetratricopeptide (TPR) repeat protein
VKLLAHSTRALRRLERRAEAKQRLDAAFARLRELKLYPVNSVKLDSPAAEAVRALADYEAWNGSLTRALEIYDRLLDQIQASKPQPETRLTDAVQLSNLYAAAAGVYRRAGRDDLVRALESRRLDLWRSWDRKLPQNPFVLRQLDQ